MHCVNKANIVTGYIYEYMKINAQCQTCFDYCKESKIGTRVSAWYQSMQCNTRCLEMAFRGGSWLVAFNTMNFFTNLLLIILVVITELPNVAKKNLSMLTPNNQAGQTIAETSVHH
ncbi:hypothetical protein YC2023_027707 [Brassica napus]